MDPRLWEVTDTTWPAAEIVERDGWRMRRGAGGGKRPSSASALAPGAVPDPAPAIAQMAAWGQPTMFRLREDETALAAALEAAGLRAFDPVLFYVCPVAALTDGKDETARIIRVSCPLAIAIEIFESCAIGARRRAMMDRVRLPSTQLMVRLGDQPVGMAFVAADAELAMIHAISVLPSARRKGAGTMLLRGAASWAAEAGAETLSLAVSRAITGACALYEGLGMTVAGGYHYRVEPQGAEP